MNKNIMQAIQYLEGEKAKLVKQREEIIQKKQEIQSEINEKLDELRNKDSDMQDKNEDVFKASGIKDRVGGGSLNTGVDPARTKIFSEFLKAVEETTEKIDYKKMDLFIIYNDTRHSFSFTYSPPGVKDTGGAPASDSISTIGELKAKATKDLNFELGVILTDEFNNILLDNLDVIDTLYPFYQFQIKDIYPVLRAILPYGWDGKKFVSQGAAMRKSFEDENLAILKETEDRKHQMIEGYYTKEEEEQGDGKKEENSIRSSKLVYSIKKASRMIYMVSIIVAYWIVFVSRAHVRENYQFLKSVQMIENTIRSSMINNQTLSFGDFMTAYFAQMGASDILQSNVVFPKMAVFQRRYSPKTCSSYSPSTSGLITTIGSSFKCYLYSGSEAQDSYGDKSEGFSYSTVPGISFTTAGRTYNTKNGYYMYVDASNLTLASQTLQSKIAKNWTDPYTAYVGFILNLYQPNFNIFMVIVSIYDFRFGFSSIVSFG